MFKETIKRAARLFGLEVRKLRTPWGGLDLLPTIGTVIDVGVAYGTKRLYDAFPDANLLLIEPNPQFFGHIRSEILSRRRGQLFEVGLGAATGVAMLRLNGPGSSMLAASKLTGISNRRFDELEVPVVRLDELLGDSLASAVGPSLLKIDTEGFEFEVLKGARGLLPRIDFVVAEISILKRFYNSYTFNEIIAWMEANGFDVFQILDSTPDGRGYFRHADVLFAKSEFVEQFNRAV